MVQRPEARLLSVVVRPRGAPVMLKLPKGGAEFHARTGAAGPPLNCYTGKVLSMAEGFVYVLLNPSFLDQVKIGLTEDASEIRARKLWTTGVPTPFIVVYDELVSNCEEVEARLHARFAGYRVSAAREFFRIPVREAIRALQEEARAFRVGDVALSNRKEILQVLRLKYPEYLKSDITAVAIVQLPDVCFLEITRRVYPHHRDEIVERVDLSIITSGGGDMFPTTDSVEDNAKRFIEELDEYSIIMTTPLFDEEAAQEIAKEWERPGGKLERTRKNL